VGWVRRWKSPLESYLRPFDDLIGDRRTARTLRETIKGIIGSGSLICERIASHSPALAAATYGSQRVIRFVKGESTKRSEVDAEHLTEKLRARGVEHLLRQGDEESEDVWLIIDESDLRKPHAQEMADLMQVRDLKGNLVPGYRTINVLGVAPGRRGMLYHRLYSSKEKDFVSEPMETQRALSTVSEALKTRAPEVTPTWIMDRGFDDVAVWRTAWEWGDHVVCRISHAERLVQYQTEEGQWQEGTIKDALDHLRPMAKTRSRMKVRIGSQKRPKMQTACVVISACPLRLTYNRNVRREGEPQETQKDLWLVKVTLTNTTLDPWLLITDWPLIHKQMAIQIFRMYRQRWAVEDAFKYTKSCLGLEAVQVLDLEGIRVLVALAWVAAGFLYEMGVTMEWPEIQFLARLGGWEERPDRKPGKTVITRGLRQLINHLVTKAFLDHHTAVYGALPSGIVDLMHTFGDAGL
jgi:hypothetical protein